MGKIEKLLEKFLSNPKDLQWRELVKILEHFDFKLMSERGMSAGSRRCFKNNNDVRLYFHQPHPGNIVKLYVIKQTIEALKKEGLL